MNVLMIGAHPDDIELGAGIAIQWHVARGDTVYCVTANTGSSGGEEDGTRICEQIHALTLLGVRSENIRIHTYTMDELAQQYLMIPNVRKWLAWSGADILYTHFPHDSHQDHVYLAQAAIPAARMCQAILFFETPSTQGFTPVLYLPATNGMGDRKVLAIAQHVTQVTRQACDLNLLDWAKGLMQHRGYEFRTGPVEAYAVQKVNWGLYGNVI